MILKRNTIQVLSLSKSNKSSVCLLQAIIMPGFCNNADTAGFQYFISQLRTENLIIRSRWFAWAFKENSFHSQSLLLYVHRNGGLAYIKIPLPVSGGITRELSHEWGHVSCFLWRQLQEETGVNYSIINPWCMDIVLHISTRNSLYNHIRQPVTTN